MGRYDYTNMGGVGGAFLTTHWSLVEKAGSVDQDQDRALIGLLLEQYWRPVYCYLRGKGHANEQAKDLTQGFFHEIVLGHELLQKADSSKGRFRSLLLTALNRYLINVHNEDNAQKRIPKEKLVSLDLVGATDLPEPLDRSDPEGSFNYAWVSNLMEQVLDETEAQCHEQGKSAHWHVFHDRVLQPILERTDSPSLSILCERYGIADTSKASNMIITVKRRFQEGLRRHLRQSVASDAEMREEIQELQRFFPEIAQDPE
jgi:hypothetical protein